MDNKVGMTFALRHSVFLFVLLLLGEIFSPYIFAENNSFGIPDSAEIRAQISRDWFEAPLDVIRNYNAEIRKNQIGVQFQVRLEEQRDEFIVVVAPKSQTKIDVYDNSGMYESVEDTYNMDSAGAWILVRNKESGAPVLARYYFAKDSGVFVQFRPDKDGISSFADLIIMDNYASRSVPLGVPFKKFYTASFAEIQELTKKTLPWNYVKSHNDFYDDTLVMIQTVRKNLDDFAYADDAAYDEEGKPVMIHNGQPRLISDSVKNKISVSSNGFTKWICDGIVEPLAGSYLRLKPLVQETVILSPTGSQGVAAARYNTNLSLDWTRNLAAAVLSVSERRTILYRDSGVDVMIEPFAASLTDKGMKNTAGYIKNSGYQIRYIKPLLYVLATTSPQYFYLAAIRQTDFSKSPEVKVFNDSAVIFPYFDKEGKFRAVVFYDGHEYSLQQFCDSFATQKTAESFLHLVRIKATSKFYPLEIRK